MARGVKRRDGELLDNNSIARMLTKLESENPISKKDACSMLNISYNTSRLNKIIEEYKERKEYDTRRRKEKRRQAITDSEKADIISMYLEGSALSEISDTVYRSTDVIKRVLYNYNIPLRNSEYSYWKPALLPEDSISEEYNENDLVYSAKYACAARIVKKVQDNETHGSVYRIWLYGDYNQYALQPYYELSDLTKLQDIGVEIKDIPSDEIKLALYETMSKLRRRKTND